MEDEHEQIEKEIAQYEAQEPQPAREPGEPNPADFLDYDDFVKAQIDFTIKKAVPQGNPAQAQVTAEAVAQGVAQALKPQVTFMDRLNAEIEAKKPDDELHGPRTKAVEWIEHCKKEEAKAKLNGDEKTARDWRQRGRWGVDDIERLGKSEAEKFAENVHADVDFISINELFRKDTIEDGKWNTGKMQHDAGVVLIRHNERNKTGLIGLPLESSPWGDVLPVHPKNMCQVQLPPQVFENFKALVYHSGGKNTPDEVFKRSWKALHRLGYAGTAKPAFEAKTKRKSNEPETDPEKMTFEEYDRWRQASENKRRGGPRKSFVIPGKK